MYLVAIHVPIYRAGDRLLVATDWRRSLELLRDSLGGRFGPVTVVAPGLSSDDRSAANETLEPLSAEHDGIRLVPSFGLRCRAMHYWRHERHQWRADLEKLLPDARVIHGTVDDLWRPIALEAVASAITRKIPTVVVQDTDQVMQQRELRPHMTPGDRLASFVYVPLLESTIACTVRRASLTMLKGQALMDRYGAIAANAKSFQDTSHSLADVVPAFAVERRAARTGPVRLVYCGRLVLRKGLDHSLRIIAMARAAGAEVELDVIGDGPSLGALVAASRSLGLADAVRFVGKRNYGPALIAELGAYDALLFTPLSEDTPRMVFDGYAAGLPVLGYDIPWVRERVADDGAGVLLPFLDVARSAEALRTIVADRGRLVRLGYRALEAARKHAAETWYRRRAEWTFEAVDRAEAGRRVWSTPATQGLPPRDMRT
jgi:glycosyltransferase involved in cell wall biosynthesis